MKRYLPIVFYFLSASCCYKEKCDIVISNPVRMELRGFAHEDLGLFKAYLVNKNDYAVVDSINIYDSLLWMDYYMFGDTVELKDHTIIIRTPITSDTVYNINYDVTEKKLDCNKCAFSKNNETKKIVSGFSVEHKGIKYTTLDTLIIRP